MKKTESKELVAVCLPRATGREENFVFVGQTVRVPGPVYRILMDADLARTRQEKFMDEQARRGREVLE